MNELVTHKNQSAKKGFLSVFLFYFLVAFEFAYMAGPFAIYFYSVYSPVLNFFNRIPALAWLIQFFLPHVARETSSPLITIIEIVGIIFAIAGFLIFCIGAIQIYYSKLTRKGAVLGGLYRYIRHPQYTSFIVCSFGLLLLWPRYIVIFLFVTLIFAYYFLARAEERECEEKFGESYLAYEKETGRFFPLLIPKNVNSNNSQSTIKKIAATCSLYLIVLSCFLLFAKGLNILTINSLYSDFTPESATVSLCSIDSDTMKEIKEIALSNDIVASKLSSHTESAYDLQYILPTEWFAAEIPMNGIVYRSGHSSTNNYNHQQYKLILTKAILREPVDSGKKILTQLETMVPVTEVWVDLTTHSVTKILDMPKDVKYDGIPVAIY